MALALHQVAPTMPGVFSLGRLDQLSSPSIVLTGGDVDPIRRDVGRQKSVRRVLSVDLA